MAVKKKSKKPTPRYYHFSLVFIVIAAIAAFYPTLGNDFVNWDDVVYIMNNDMIKTLSIENLRKMINSFFMGNYHPLTILSFAFDYSVFNLSAQGYHLHNLFLHLVNAVLVYFVTWHMFRKNNLAAFIVSVLFAVHPMHVESVAWVSERKDLLYTMYFLLAMLAYVFYNQTRHSRYFYYTLAFFVLSLLAKAQAVTLPVVLLLIDYFLERKPDIRMFLEKVPFFALSLFFGIIAILAQKADGSINPVGTSLVNSLFYAQYSVWVYLYKLLLPVNLTCLYNYPFSASGGVPFYIYLSPVIVAILFVLIVYTWKKHRAICFGLLFFIVVIFPVLQFLPVGQAIVAERYSYIPYIGLFFIVAALFIQFRGKLTSSGGKRLMNNIGIGIIVVFCLLTFNRTQVWANSITLWTDVMDKNPACIDAYVNRSYMYIQNKQYDKAIQDCNEGMKLDSNYFKFYINRGTAYRDLGVFDMALKDFNRAIHKNPKSFDTYLDRGILYTDRFNKYDSGISDFKYFLKFRPYDKNGLYNLAVVYYKKQLFDSSVFYCKKTLELAPDYGSAYYIWGLVYSIRQDFKNAYENGLKAQALGCSIDPALLEEWRQRANILNPKIK